MFSIFKKPIFWLLILTLLIRLYRLEYPSKYVFDEVYHAFTAQEYVKGNKEAWNPWSTPPPNVAFEWTHPPLAKEIMALSMFLVRSTDSWAWRLPGVLMGTTSVFLLYLLGKNLFKSELVGIFSAAIFSLDGLNFVQSRTGMNDSYLICFSLASVYFILKKNYLLTCFFLGLALASKWTGIYLFILLLILTVKDKSFSKIPYLIIVPAVVYLLSYIPYFYQGYNFDQFIELQKQMWGYHTNLKASHDYASPAWSWPFNLYPVWYFVDYKDNNIGNIFASGNPIVFWMGFGAIIITTTELIRKISFFSKNILKLVSENLVMLSEPIFLVLLGYFIFWLPWMISPRIMFLYHYLPSTPFLALALGYQIHKLWKGKDNIKEIEIVFGLIILGFIFTYPFLTGVPLPKNLVQLFFLTNLTKNPFGP